MGDGSPTKTWGPEQQRRVGRGRPRIRRQTRHRPAERHRDPHPRRVIHVLVHAPHADQRPGGSLRRIERPLTGRQPLPDHRAARRRMQRGVPLRQRQGGRRDHRHPRRPRRPVHRHAMRGVRQGRPRRVPATRRRRREGPSLLPLRNRRARHRDDARAQPAAHEGPRASPAR